MARRGSGETIAIVAVIGVFAFMGLIAFDCYAYQGRLQLCSRMKAFLQKLGLNMSSPITPAPAPGPQGGLPSGADQFEGSPEEAALLEKEKQIAAKEPETAGIARRMAYRAMGYPTKSRIRVGNMGN